MPRSYVCSLSEHLQIRALNTDDREKFLGHTFISWTPEEGEEGGFGALDITYIGSYEEPDLWTLHWEHFPTFLRNEGPGYLSDYYPGEDVPALKALILSLFPEVQVE